MVKHGSVGESMRLLLTSARLRKQRWGRNQGCILNLKAHPLEIHFLQLSPPSLQFHSLSTKCHYLRTEDANTWDYEWYFTFKPEHTSIFPFYNLFLCLCCYIKVHISLNILCFVFGKKILIFVYTSLKGKYCNTQQRKTIYLHLHGIHNQHIQIQHTQYMHPCV